MNLLCGLALYRANDGVRVAAAETEILDHVRLCAAFIRANLECDLQYNHLLKNYVALAVYTAGVGERPFVQSGGGPRRAPRPIERLCDGRRHRRPGTGG